MQCDDCGAVCPSWLASPHKCHAKFTRRRFTGTQTIETPEPHSAAEFEEGYLATGNQFYQFYAGTP